MIDPRIPMMGQPANILGEMARGTQLAGMQNDLQRQAKMQNLFAQQGPGIAQGDPRAMNMLAQMDPMAAFNMGQQRQEAVRADTRLNIDKEKLQMIRDQTTRALIEAQDRKAAEAEAKQFVEGARSAIGLYASGDHEMFTAAVSDLLGYEVNDPEQGMALLGSVYEGVSAYRGGLPKQAEPLSTPGKVAADIAAGILPEGTPLQSGPLLDLSGANIGGQPGGPMLVDEKKGILAVPDPSQPNGIRYEFVPGGPADLERKAQQTDAMQDVGRSEEKDRQQNLKMGTTLTSIGLNIKEIEDGGFPVTGPLGALAARIDGSPASDFRNRTGQISTAAALSEVQNMRDNSPTGGAVGQLTDSEREAIGLSVTALNNSSSGPEYVRAAKAYRKLMLDIAHGEGNWEINEANNEVKVRPATQGPNPPRIVGDADYNALPSGATFIAPDGTMRRKP